MVDQRDTMTEDAHFIWNRIQRLVEWADRMSIVSLRVAFFEIFWPWFYIWPGWLETQAGHRPDRQGSPRRNAQVPFASADISEEKFSRKFHLRSMFQISSSTYQKGGNFTNKYLENLLNYGLTENGLKINIHAAIVTILCFVRNLRPNLIPEIDPSSWIMRGMINFLTGDSQVAADLRDRFIFKVKTSFLVYINLKCRKTKCQNWAWTHSTQTFWLIYFLIWLCQKCLLVCK
jgi:hypothetical protein